MIVPVWYIYINFTKPVYLYAGIYTLVVQDGNGCSTTFFQEINEPACNLYFDTTITYVSQPLCFGQAGSITWMAKWWWTKFNYTITNNITGNFYYRLQSPRTIYIKLYLMEVLIFKLLMSTDVLIF